MFNTLYTISYPIYNTKENINKRYKHRYNIHNIVEEILSKEKIELVELYYILYKESYNKNNKENCENEDNNSINNIDNYYKITYKLYKHIVKLLSNMKVLSPENIKTFINDNSYHLRLFLSLLLIDSNILYYCYNNIIKDKYQLTANSIIYNIFKGILYSYSKEDIHNYYIEERKEYLIYFIYPNIKDIDTFIRADENKTIEILVEIYNENTTNNVIENRNINNTIYTDETNIDIIDNIVLKTIIDNYSSNENTIIYNSKYNLLRVLKHRIYNKITNHYLFLLKEYQVYYNKKYNSERDKIAIDNTTLTNENIKIILYLYKNDKGVVENIKNIIKYKELGIEDIIYYNYFFKDNNIANRNIIDNCTTINLININIIKLYNKKNIEYNELLYFIEYIDNNYKEIKDNIIDSIINEEYNSNKREIKDYKIIIENIIHKEIIENIFYNIKNNIKDININTIIDVLLLYRNNTHIDVIMDKLYRIDIINRKRAKYTPKDPKPSSNKIEIIKKLKTRIRKNKKIFIREFKDIISDEEVHFLLNEENKESTQNPIDSEKHNEHNKINNTPIKHNNITGNSNDSTLIKDNIINNNPNIKENVYKRTDTIINNLFNTQEFNNNENEIIDINIINTQEFITFIRILIKRIDKNKQMKNNKIAIIEYILQKYNNNIEDDIILELLSIIINSRDIKDSTLSLFYTFIKNNYNKDNNAYINILYRVSIILRNKNINGYSFYINIKDKDYIKLLYNNKNYIELLYILEKYTIEDCNTLIEDNKMFIKELLATENEDILERALILIYKHHSSKTIKIENKILLELLFKRFRMDKITVLLLRLIEYPMLSKEEEKRIVEYYHLDPKLYIQIVGIKENIDINDNINNKYRLPFVLTENMNKELISSLSTKIEIIKDYEATDSHISTSSIIDTIINTIEINNNSIEYIIEELYTANKKYKKYLLLIIHRIINNNNKDYNKYDSNNNNKDYNSNNNNITTYNNNITTYNKNNNKDNNYNSNITTYNYNNNIINIKSIIKLIVLINNEDNESICIYYIKLLLSITDNQQLEEVQKLLTAKDIIVYRIYPLIGCNTEYFCRKAEEKGEREIIRFYRENGLL